MASLTTSASTNLNGNTDLKRTASLKSSTAGSVASTVSTKNKDYWYNLICLFTGLGTNPNSRGATSLNNKDNFPGPGDERPKTPRPSSSRRNTAPPATKRSSSFLRPSLSKRQSTSRSSLFSRKSKLSVVEEPASSLKSVPETGVLTQDDDLASVTYTDSRSSIPSDPMSPASTTSSGSEKLVAVLKDGQTHWVPEHVISQYLGGQTHRPPSPTRFTVPRRSSLRRGRKSGMRIAIPSNQFSPPPEAVTNAIPLHRRPTRPVHPLERSSYESQSPPGLDSDHSSTQSPNSSDMRSPASQYGSSGTSQSSFELQTPRDLSPTSPMDNKFFAVMDPTRQGVFDDELVTPRYKDISTGDLQTPIAPHRNKPVATPTLSEAAIDLENHLEPKSPSAPAIPQRSRRRTTTIKEAPEKKPAITYSPMNPYSDAVSINEVSLALSSQATECTSPQGKNAEAPISTNAAEAVIHALLSAVDNPADLFNTALINKGFYNVYKQHELDLVKGAFERSNPAAAECAEVGFEIEFSLGRNIGFGCNAADAKRYLKHVKRNAYTLTALKSLILTRCRDQLRPGTVAALRGGASERRLAIDSALWRIWTFCKRFGGATGRETHLADQIDWLLGGFACRSTHHESAAFGLSNGLDGLQASELHDVAELWSCMRSLLQGILPTAKTCNARIYQARLHGVFTQRYIRPGDVIAEAHTLSDWVNHLLSLGPAVVVDLAAAAADESDRVFRIARELGLTHWHYCQRSDFLRQALDIVLTERGSPQRTSFEDKALPPLPLKPKPHKGGNRPVPPLRVDTTVGGWMAGGRCSRNLNRCNSPHRPRLPDQPTPIPLKSSRSHRHTGHRRRYGMNGMDSFDLRPPKRANSSIQPTPESAKRRPHLSLSKIELRASSVYDHSPGSAVSPRTVVSVKAYKAPCSRFSATPITPTVPQYGEYLTGLTPGERNAFQSLVAARGWSAKEARHSVLRLRERVGEEKLEGVMNLAGWVEGFTIERGLEVQP